MFGKMPAYGFYIRHVRGLEMDNVEVSYMNPDARPPFLLEHVSQAEFNNVKGQHASGVAMLRMNDVKGFTNYSSPVMDDTKQDTVKNRQVDR
jgi:hypothetical protein